MSPNDDPNGFDLDAWLDTHDTEPKREELEADYLGEAGC